MRASTRRLIVTAAIVLASVAISAQMPGPPKNTLVDLIVWGNHVTVSSESYPPDLRAEMDRYRQRADAYRSKRPGATTNDEWQMVIPAWIRYERRLVAMSADPRAPSLAFEYVSNLRPCYEWEGLPECPEREAKFADAYHASHPQGPFSHYLPLLSAHRWLCAAEAYETANDQAALASSRRLYEQRLAAARTSTSLLVRAAADELAARGRCLPER